MLTASHGTQSMKTCSASVAVDFSTSRLETFLYTNKNSRYRCKLSRPQTEIPGIVINFSICQQKFQVLLDVG